MNTLCACGCGHELPDHHKGRRGQYYSGACKQRVHRATVDARREHNRNVLVTKKSFAPSPEERESLKVRESSKVNNYLSLAIRKGLVATLTLDEWLCTLDDFRWGCAYCLVAPYECFEHFVPIGLGGGTTASNCVPACNSCNKKKLNYNPWWDESSIGMGAHLGRVRTYLQTRIAYPVSVAVGIQPTHIKPIAKYPGAKWNLAQWITSHFPDHRRYVEPYAGSAACFFAKEPAKHEILNDLNGSIVNLFHVLRTRPAELAEMIALSPWSEEEYRMIEGNIVCDDPIEHARRFLVRSWQAHGGTINQVSGWKHNGLNGNVFPSHLWKKIPERLLVAADRLKDAEIRNRPALEIIQYYNSPDTLLYVDPPYVLSTRSRKYYSHEMTDGDHIELLEALDRHPGMVVLSGYAHALYDDRMSHWQRVTMQTAGEHGKHQTEVLWLNAKVPATVQQSLFEEEGIA